MVRKLLVLFLIATGLAYGQYTPTPNIGLEIPANGSTNWNVPLNYNFQLLDALIGGTTQNPGVGLTLKPIFGNGAPAIPCSSSNSGQQYFDTSVTPFNGYVCDGSQWNLQGGSGGTLPSNAIVYGLTPTTSRAAQPSDLTALLSTLTGCTSSNFVYAPANGACIGGASIPPAGIPLSTGSTYGASFSTTGSGSLVVLNNAPTLIAPVLGSALATSINNVSLNEQVSVSNVFIGSGQTYPTNPAVTDDTAIGALALANDGGGLNTAVGSGALTANTTGFANTALGEGSMASNTSGTLNTAFGTATLFSNTVGGSNTGDGQEALQNNISGNQNTAVGDIALNDNITGSNNVGVGFETGFNAGTPNTNINNSTFIGAEANSSTDNLTNMVVIGFQAQGTSSNQITIGSASNTTSIIYGVPTFPSLVSAGTQCAQITATGVLSGTGSACGGGGGSGNTTSTSLTTNSLSKANGANSIINSLFTDDGTNGGYGGTGGFTVTSTLPGTFQMVAGTGSYPTLLANSAGFMGPVTGGTSYKIQLPNVISAAGVPHLGATATVNGVLVSQFTNSLIGLTDLSASGTPSASNFLRGNNSWSTPGVQGSVDTGWVQVGTVGSTVVVAGLKTSFAGTITNLQIVSGGGSCTTAPFFNVFDGTTNIGTPIQATTPFQTKGNATNQTQTLGFGAGDNIGIYISTAGATCTAAFSVSATYVTNP